jgi:hypothetical protein
MDNDNIRPPDSIITDRLIDHNYTYSNLDDDLNTAIEISKNEYNLLQIELFRQQKEQEQKEQKEQELEKQSRQHKFHNIKIQISKLILFDRPNLRYYELILTIIEMFELCLINQYNINENEYINIFKILKSIRLPNNEIEEFKKIIIYI